MSHSLLTLEIPAAPDFVFTARLFIGAAGRHFGADEQTVEDLKLAVSEACSGAINAGRKNLVITASHAAEALEIAVKAALDPARPSPVDLPLPPEIPNSYSTILLESLFPGTEINLSGNSFESVKFVARLNQNTAGA